MNKKTISIIIGIIILIIIICSVGFFVIHKQDEELQQAKLQQQKIEQQIKANEAKEKAQAEQEAKEKQAAAEKAAKEKAAEEASATAHKNEVNNLSNIKSQFLNEMANLKVANPFPGGHLGQATQQELLYQAWDGELNKIWGVLRENLPQTEMSNLTKNEEGWIQEKAQYQAGYNQGEELPTQELAQMTKQRCYYLVNNYM